MISANEARLHLWTDIIIWKDRKILIRVIINEPRAAKHEAFSRPQGESVLNIVLQVGVIASNNL